MTTPQSPDFSLQRREAFLRDISAAMRLVNGPDQIGERFCKAAQWEKDLYNANVWCDPTFVRNFSIEDYPELLPATRTALVAVVNSFRRTTTPQAGRHAVSKENRILASTHLLTIVDRLLPVLEAYWQSRAGS